MTTVLNHNYTITCTDKSGRTVSFRDITGADLESLDYVLGGDSDLVKPEHVIDILSKLCTNPNADFGRLTPRTIRILYSEITTNILSNYMSKENWLRQCYSIQNGSFQSLFDMESVPMSKFVAMCQIHGDAIDKIKNPPTSTES